jgi:hypothetical protein
MLSERIEDEEWTKKGGFETSDEGEKRGREEKSNHQTETDD